MSLRVPELYLKFTRGSPKCPQNVPEGPQNVPNGHVCLQKYVRDPKVFPRILDMHVLAQEVTPSVTEVYTNIPEVFVRVPKSVAEDPRSLSEGPESESAGPSRVTLVPESLHEGP